MFECMQIYLGIHVCVSMNVYVCEYILSMWVYGVSVSQNVCIAVSAAVAGVGKMPEKLMMKVKVLPWDWAI